MRLWFPRPYEHTTHGGKTVDWLTKCALLDLEWILGYELTIDQGSYNHGAVAVSAGTHNGGGAVDLAPWDHERKVLHARQLGFFASHRLAIPGVWQEHIHMILCSDQRLSVAAKAQVREYALGRDGLAAEGPDLGPRQYVNRSYQWPGGRAALAKVKRNKKRFHPAKSAAVTPVKPKPAPHHPSLPTKPAGKSETPIHEGKTMTESNIETPAAPVVDEQAPAPAAEPTPAPVGATSDAGAAPEPPTYVPPAEPATTEAEKPSSDLSSPVPAEPVTEGQTMVLGKAPDPAASPSPAAAPSPAPAPAASPSAEKPGVHPSLLAELETLAQHKIEQLIEPLIQEVIQRLRDQGIQTLETLLESLR